MRPTLRLKLYAGFGILLVFIFAIGTLCYSSLNRMLDDDRRVDHSENVISKIEAFEINLKRAQADYRAYLLSDHSTLLQLAESEMNLAYKDALELQKMTEDNPSEKQRFETLMPLLQQRLQNFEANRSLCLSGHFEKAVEQFKALHPVQAMDPIDHLTAQTIAEEENLLIKRRDSETSSSHMTSMIVVAGGVAATLFAILALFAIGQEIKKREAAQELLQLNEHRLFQFLEAIPLGIFVLDAKGKPFYANQKARELLGKGIVAFSESKDLSTIYSSFVAGTEDPYPNEKSPVVRALNGERSSVEDMEIHHPDGRIIPIQVWGTPVTDLKGNVNFALAVFSDITERKQVEEMKQSLISVASHQLKTPVAQINGYIENLLDGLAGELSASQKDYLMDMREIGVANFRLISDFLNLSKIQRGLLDPSLERASWSTIVEFGLRDYKEIISRKGLELRLEGLEKDVFVMADMDKTVEALRNLISNAVKFTDRGSITLRVEVKAPWGTLRVADTGPGISEAAMKQMFSQKRILGEEAGRAGAGIGLYIVKRFLDVQGGSIAVETEKGKGTCFALSLPLAP
ncbi:MAG TPA: ATP-binding protein [bacterium]|nr:ATP-binding protein [bacterium]